MTGPILNKKNIKRTQKNLILLTKKNFEKIEDEISAFFVKIYFAVIIFFHTENNDPYFINVSNIKVQIGTTMTIFRFKL